MTLTRTTCLLSLVMASGCCHLRQSFNARPPQPVPAEVAARVAYTKPNPLVCAESNMVSTAHFAIDRITMTAVADRTNRTLALDYYRPVGTNRTPIIVVLPILGGGYPLEKIFCAYFARHGMAALLVRRESLKRTIDHLGEINDALLYSAIDARQAIDWVETRPELDASRLGVFGISMGGIRAAFLTPLDTRIRASVIGLAGCDLPYIIAYSTEPGLTRRRNGYLKKCHLRECDLVGELKKTITCDPLATAACIDPAKVLMVLATCDTSVPTKKGLELRKAMGKPETVFLPTGHYSAILFLPYLESASVRFFKEKFAGQ
jgi:hypothetical protein